MHEAQKRTCGNDGFKMKFIIQYYILWILWYFLALTAKLEWTSSDHLQPLDQRQMPSVAVIARAWEIGGPREPRAAVVKKNACDAPLTTTPSREGRKSFLPVHRGGDIKPGQQARNKGKWPYNWLLKLRQAISTHIPVQNDLLRSCCPAFCLFLGALRNYCSLFPHSIIVTSVCTVNCENLWS